MNRIIAFLLLGIGSLALAVGLLFLCAASRDANRLPLAIILLVLGGGLAAGGGLLWRRQRELSKEAVADRIVAMAQADDDAELTVAEVVAGLRLPEAAVLQGLELLVRRGRCRREFRDDHAVYVFPGLKESKLIRKCAYCGTIYPVKEPLRTCRKCGGTVELVKEGG